MDARFEDEVKPTAASSDTAFYKHKSVDILILEANTAYYVTMEAIQFGQGTHLCIGSSSTPPTSKLVLLPIYIKQLRTEG